MKSVNVCIGDIKREKSNIEDLQKIIEEHENTIKDLNVGTKCPCMSC